LRDDPSLKAANIDAKKLAVEAETLLVRFPNARYNSDEHRQLRAALYRPLLALDQGARSRVIDAIIPVLVDGAEDRD
ncbi:MAG: type I restriction enzyme subunit R domain-containing protein, partial [Gemmatimonadaceae bacterium]